MWRSPAARFLLHPLLGAGDTCRHAARRCWHGRPFLRPFPYLSSASTSLSSSGDDFGAAAASTTPEVPITFAEAKRLIRLVNVEALKRRLERDGDEVIGYAKLLEVCEGMGVARSRDEAAAFARILDEAGVVLLFRNKVYLHPDKVVDLVRRVVPLALTPENDPRREDLKQLQKKKEELDMLAHKEVHRILWSGLGVFVVQVGLFFRLTFWDLSWDIMEPIAFFATTTSLLVGYTYFLLTSRDPTYQDLMQRMYFSRKRKLYQRHNFNIEKYIELQKHCKCPLD